jgi:hypothetical protein
MTVVGGYHGVPPCICLGQRPAMVSNFTNSRFVKKRGWLSRVRRSGLGLSYAHAENMGDYSRHRLRRMGRAVTSRARLPDRPCDYSPLKSFSFSAAIGTAFHRTEQLLAPRALPDNYRFRSAVSEHELRSGAGGGRSSGVGTGARQPTSLPPKMHGRSATCGSQDALSWLILPR